MNVMRRQQGVLGRITALGAKRALKGACEQVSPLVAAQLVGMSQVELSWEDGTSQSFHPLWLRDNCPSQRHPGTRQRLRSPADLPLSLTVSSIAVANDTLHVHWEDRTEPSAFSGSWLRSIGVQEGESGSALSGGHTSPTDTARYDPPSVMRMHFDELRDGGDAARWKLASALGEDGAMLLEGVPSVCSPISSVANQPRRDDGPTPTTDPEAVTDGVRAIAEILGPLQPNIYGELFDVVSAGDAAINIAYTSEAIGPHMDLCYYESPPGLQLLHCLRFDEQVVGGESLLIDAFAVAERLRHNAPEAFDVLTRVPATFVKDHSQRAQPVLLSYERPHFALEPHSRRLTGVFWSPPFEGPLRKLPLELVEAYYSAYRAFHAAIEAAPRWEHRLRPGEMIVFNNRRMLHGRHAFELLDGAGRHLRGGYVNIDEFANRYNLLRRTFQGQDPTGRHTGMALLGNQDWASRATSLPFIQQSSHGEE